MNTPEEILRTMRPDILLAAIRDMASDDLGIAGSTFLLATTPEFKNVGSLELFDLCVKILREKVRQ